MSGTMMPTMCQILVVTQFNLTKRFIVLFTLFTAMALHSSGGCYATTRRLQQYGRPYQPKHSPSILGLDLVEKSRLCIVFLWRSMNRPLGQGRDTSISGKGPFKCYVIFFLLEIGPPPTPLETLITFNLTPT